MLSAIASYPCPCPPSRVTIRIGTSTLRGASSLRRPKGSSSPRTSGSTLPFLITVALASITGADGRGPDVKRRSHALEYVALCLLMIYDL